MTNYLMRTALVGLGASALCACASPKFPTVLTPTQARAAPSVAPSPPAQPASVVARDADPVAPQATAPVEVRALEPPARTQLAQAEPPPSPPAAAAPPPAAAPPQASPAPPPPPPAAAPPPVEPPRPARPPEPTYRTVTTRSVTGRVVEAEGAATTYKVKKGDSLAKVADRLGTDIEQLARDNRLKRPYRLQPGQVLKGPRTSAKAYVVGSGDTLFSIARRFGVTPDALRAENGLRRNASLAPGHRLRLPDGYRDRGSIVTTARVQNELDEPLVQPRSGRGSRAARPPVEDEPAYRTVTSREATGRVVEIDGPARTYRVRKGDNLAEVADRLDTTVERLARDNHLKRPYRLRPGQVLRGAPGRPAKAYVVASGDTVSEIARRFEVSETALRRSNGLRRGARVAPGRRLRLPAGYRDRGPLTSTSRVAGEEPYRPEPTRREPSAQLPGGPQPYAPPRTAARPSYSPPIGSSGVFGAPTPTPQPSDTQLSQMGRGVFVWPVRGDVISGFGGRTGGPRNDGVNIRATTGDAVRAAAAGDVVYAGDQVPGFGNLVLIKHADGWVTAYGHLSRVDVRMQQKVTQGQQIGEAGSTGGVTEPQLHFEVRYAPNPQERAKPIDPTLVLPR